jgi:hypothetical protein
LQGQDDLKADQLNPNGNVADYKVTKENGVLYTVGRPAGYNYFALKAALSANAGADAPHGGN